MELKKQLENTNQEARRVLLDKINSFNEFIKSGFGFGEVTREHNPKEYFVVCVFLKIHSLGVSIENCIFSNDVFLSIYLFRYIYELYIKVFYIFSGLSEKEILSRIDEFFSNDKWNFTNIKNKINDKFLHPEFKETHQLRYKLLSRFVHPNYESFKLCLNRTNDQQFEFLEPNIHLALWYSIEIIKHFLNIEILNFHKKINKEKLERLQGMASINFS